ncbi:MAG TPA: hypothetical protein VGK90_02430 [Rhizomicrobium sp.]|jgi:hypothetical protein
MHIHLPKPAHGWRAVLGEIGIIVLGILIALTLEQLIESVHESRIAGEARESVKAEVRENLFWIEERQRREPCIRRRLAELGDLLQRARAGAPTPLVHYIGTVPHAKITNLRWQANAAAGRASLFPGDEQRLLGNMYFSTEQFRAAQDQEEIIWSQMRFIQGPQQLSPLDIHDLAIFLAEARYRNWIVLLTIHRSHQWAARMHLAAANPAGIEGPSSRPQICEKLTAPLVASDNISGPDAFAEPGDVP